MNKQTSILFLGLCFILVSSCSPKLSTQGTDGTTDKITQTAQNKTEKTTTKTTKTVKQATDLVEGTKEMAKKAEKEIEQMADKAMKNADVPLPLDPAIKMGKLDNGLTYYIRKNQKPEKRAEFRLVVNAGSILEADEQQGLAHFVEHMAFNGTKNFKKNEIIDFFEAAGMKFGAHANAYTSFDETVYMLQLPTDSTEIMNKGFQVMQDWASALLFEGEEIDKERGVVIEEWRSRLSPGQRLLEQYKDVLFKNARYAKRLPIGKKDILESFDHSTLVQFYKDWYRPDLMGFIIVGDVDVAEMEAKIKTHFSDLKNPENAKKRENYNFPPHDETVVSVATDKEESFSRVTVYYKHPHRSLVTEKDYKNLIVRSLYNGMLNQRLEELKQQVPPPFIFSSSSYGGFYGRSTDVYRASAFVAEGGIEKGLETILTENERVLQHGFTTSELERQKVIMLKNMEKLLKEKDKTESRGYAREYVTHFLEGEAAPGIELEYALYEKYLPQISLEAVNALAKEFITDKNIAIIVTAPEKEGMETPSEEQILATFKSVKNKEIAPYEEKEIASTLIEKVPEAVKITNTRQIEELGVTEITFANGAVAVLKPTDFKNDEILFSTFSFGGSSVYDDASFTNAKFAGDIISESGIADFSKTDLQKMMAGKQLQLAPYIGTLMEGMRGSCSPDDLETFLQLLHLHFTKTRKDDNAFEAYRSAQLGIYQNLLSNPQYYFFNEVERIKTQDHLRADLFPTAEELNSLNYDKMLTQYQERFADADDFTFFFVGNFEVDKIQKLLATYIGTLPSIEGDREMWKDVGMSLPSGIVQKELKKGVEPKSQVNITVHGGFAWTGENRHALYSAVDVLRIRLRETMREDQGGVYGVRVGASPRKYPKGKYEINVSFVCAPENVQELIATVKKEMQALKDTPTDAANIQKVKETQKRTFETNAKKNNFWLGNLVSRYRNGGDPKGILDYPKYVEKLTAERVQKAAQQYFDMDSYLEIILNPEK